MGKVAIEESTLIGIADAIREQTGYEGPVPTTDMRAMIKTIEAGGTKLDNVASFDGDMNGVTLHYDNDTQSLFGSSYSTTDGWVRIDDVWSDEDLVGATVVTTDANGQQRTFEITEDMIETIMAHEDRIIRVKIDVFGANDLVCVDYEHLWLPTGLYHFGTQPITVTKKSAIEGGGNAAVETCTVYVYGNGSGSTSTTTVNVLIYTMQYDSANDTISLVETPFAVPAGSGPTMLIENVVVGSMLTAVHRSTTSTILYSSSIGLGGFTATYSPNMTCRVGQVRIGARVDVENFV